MRRAAVMGALWICACAGNLDPHFDAKGFVSPQNSYGISYVKGSRRLLGEDWSVSNFRYDEGRPTQILTEGDFEGALNWRFADGTTQRFRAVVFDLRLSHRSNAVIWVRVIPIPPDLRNKPVGILAENFVNNLNGMASSDYFGDPIQKRRVATKILASRDMELLGQRARSVRFDLVNLDQLELDPNAPRMRAEIILVEVRMLKTLRSSTEFDVGGYLLLGYTNDAVRFDEHIDEFYELAGRLRRVSFR